MATKNPPTSDNHRIGTAKDRSQVLNTKTGKFTKYNTYTGQHIDQNNNGKPKGAGKKK